MFYDFANVPYSAFLINQGNEKKTNPTGSVNMDHNSENHPAVPNCGGLCLLQYIEAKTDMRPFVKLTFSPYCPDIFLSSWITMVSVQGLTH